jgi:hypothetical protein
MKNKKKSIFAILFALWVVFVLLSNIPLIAQTLIDYSDMDDKVVSRLTFPQDGKQGHYYVERYNLLEPGLINLVYTTDSNSLEVDCTNIKVLKIYCRELYEKKSEDVFKRDPNLDSNYYKIYFIERDHFHVHIYTQQKIEKLEWIDTPIPYNVTVNGREWWLTETNYTYNNDGIVLTHVPPGHSYVDLYFKSNDKNAPVAKIKVNKNIIGVGESVTFNANESYDPDGKIIRYVWDLGEASYKMGIQIEHTFTKEGNYKVILTVKDDDYLIDNAYQEIRVVKRVMNISKSLDKPIATPGSTVTYTFDSTIDTSWAEGVKDIIITDVLHDNLTYVDASPKPSVKDQTVTWTVRQAFDSFEVPKITLQVKIDETIENNTIISNNATLTYKGFSNQVFPNETTNTVETKVRFNTILAPQIRRPVPDVLLFEDAPPHKLYLSSYEYDFQDTDTDLKWYVNGENESLYILSGEYSDDDVITITPVPDAYGNNLVTLYLMDSDGFSTNQPLWVNITPVNDPPLFLPSPDLILHYDDPYTFNYEPYVYDIDNPLHDLGLYVSESVDGLGDITYTSGSSQSNTDNAEVSGLEVTYDYPERYTGKTIFISLIVFDGNASDAENIQIIVTDDYTPKLEKKLPNVYLKEGEVRKNVFDLDDYFTDPDKDSLFYSFGETHVDVVINDDHTVDMSSETSWFGVDTVTFRARDPIGAIAEDVVLVLVEPENDPPVIEGVPGIFVIHYDADYMYDLTPYVSDEDNETEDLSMILQDIHIRTDPLNNLMIIMNYPQAMVGMDVPVVLTITDGIDTDSVTVTIRVTENWPPQITFKMPDVSFNEDETLFNAFNLNDYFIDKDSKTLFYSYGNEHINISINPVGSVGFSAEMNWFGTELVTFRATDSTEAFVENSIIVTVNPVNDPSIIEPLPKLEGVVRQLLKFDLTDYIYDVDNNFTELNISVLSHKMDILLSGNELLIYTHEPVKDNITVMVNDGQYLVTANMIVEIKGEKEKGDPGLIEFLMSIIWLIMVLLLIILSISGYAGYRRYAGDYKIDEIFWIHNDGILIQHVTSKRQKHRGDREVISGMLTAIINFAQEAFADDDDSDRKSWGIKEIQMNDNNILIDKSENTFLATIFSGISGKKLYKQSGIILKALESKYKGKLVNWSGNPNEFIGAQGIIRHKVPSVNEYKPNIT